ncbi:hypothetical protein U9M48_030890 [Paspalum notatum var. saurae]|uniref:Uncharacterized protein n=1 Tax=Paspalum notatum var. saurae TaxID=547442 RepID=A0AAQ3X349_PASNO
MEIPRCKGGLTVSSRLLSLSRRPPPLLSPHRGSLPHWQSPPTPPSTPPSPRRRP